MPDLPLLVPADRIINVTRALAKYQNTISFLSLPDPAVGMKVVSSLNLLLICFFLICCRCRDANDPGSARILGKASAVAVADSQPSAVASILEPARSRMHVASNGADMTTMPSEAALLDLTDPVMAGNPLALEATGTHLDGS